MIIICSMIMTATSVFAEDDLIAFCDKQSLDKVYYLIDKKDFSAATDFFLLDDLQFHFDKTDFLRLIGQRNRISTFYDFDNLALLHANKELLHTLDNNLPDYRVEKEQIIYTDTSSISGGIQRFEVKKYNKKTSVLDKHPFFGRIKRKERSILIDHLSAVSEDLPESISESIKINSTEKVVLITLYGVPRAALTFSNFTISNIGVPNTSLLFKIEIFHEQQDNLKKHEKKYLHNLFCSIDENFHSRFPHIKPYSWFGYVEYNKLAAAFQPSHALFRQYPVIFSIGQIICLTCIGFLLLYFILGRYTRQTSHLRISKVNHHQ